MNTKTKILNRKNNELDKKLNAENSKIMEDIVCYLRVANISDYHQEVVRQDLFEILLSAQEREENAKTIIGEDYKLFCDEVIESLPGRSRKECILSFLDTILLCTCILGVITLVASKETFDIVRNMITDQPLNFEISISIGSLLAYVIILAAAFLIVHIIGRTSLRTEKKHIQSKFRKFLIGGFVGGSIMGIFLTIAWIGKQTIFTVNILVAYIFILVLYIAHKLLQMAGNA